ncbi:MAG: hypothetical protein AAF125_27080 [Chloroflexota bacterium]
MQPPPDARTHNPALSELTAAALEHGMEKDPEDRFESVSDFVAALT